MASRGDIHKDDLQPILYENWITLPLFGTLEKTGSFTKLKSRDYLETGNFPVIDQGEAKNSGYVDDESLIYNGSLPVILFGDHTRNVKYVNTKFAVGADGVKILKPQSFLDPRFFFFYLKSLRIPSLGYSRHYSLLKTVEIPIPSLKEQKLIADKLDNIFLCLDKISSRVNNIKAIKQKAIDSSLFNLIENVPYKKEALSRFLQERTERIGTEWDDKRKLGVSARDGIIDLDTGMKTTFENYKIVMPGDFVYNAMRVNIGSIAQYNGSDIAITSPDYIVFKVASHLSPKLLLGFLKSPSGITEINNNTKGSVRSRLYFKSLSNINMPVAPLKIQQKAELLLKWFDDSIAALTTVTDKLEKVKQESLNKAFRGELEPQDPTDEPASKLLERILQDQTSIKEKPQDNLYVTQSNTKRVQNKHISMVEISLLTIIENTFQDQDFSFEELNDSLQQLSKSDYVQLKKQFFELLRNDKYKRKTNRITTTIDTPSGTMKYKLQKHETIKA